MQYLSTGVQNMQQRLELLLPHVGVANDGELGQRRKEQCLKFLEKKKAHINTKIT